MTATYGFLRNASSRGVPLFVRIRFLRQPFEWERHYCGKCKSILRGSRVRPSRAFTIVLIGLLIGTTFGPQIRWELNKVGQLGHNGNSDQAGSGSESRSSITNLRTIYVKIQDWTCHVMSSGTANLTESFVNRDLNLTQCTVRLEDPTYSWNSWALKSF